MPTPWPFLGNDSFGETARSLLVRGRWPASSFITGPVGIGKAHIAEWLVQADLCTAGSADKPCGNCPPCRQVASRTHPNVVVLDGGQDAISIATVRESLQRFILRGQEHRWLLCLDADRLTEAASNALLKTIEEPQPAMRILCTSSRPGQIPKTILSRCAIFRLHRLAITEVPHAQRAVAARVAGRPGLMEELTEQRLEEDARIARDLAHELAGHLPVSRTEQELPRVMDVEEAIIRDLLWRKAGQRSSAWAHLDDDLDQVCDTISLDRLFHLADRYAQRRDYLAAHVSLRHVYDDLHHLA